MADADVVDCIIIGSGVAGALLARELAGAGMGVALLEAGDTFDRSDAAARYRETLDRNLQAPFRPWPWLSERPFPEGEAYQPMFQQGVGGTTWHWTAITPRFLPEDFELHSRFGVGVDWPISYNDLEPWYVQAERALGVAGDDGQDHGSPRSAPYPQPAIPMTYGDRVIARHLARRGIHVAPLPAARNSRAYDGRPPCQGNNTCTPLCPTGASYSADTDVRKAVARGARLITRAVAYRFDMDGGGRLRAVHYRHPDGSSRRLAGRRFILACNAIQTPRLLLMSAGRHAPRGLANSSGQVGRNLMDHALFVREFSMPEALYIGRGPQSVSTLLTGRSGAFRKRHAAAKFFIGNDLNIQRLATGLLGDEGHLTHIVSDLRKAAVHLGQIGAEVESLPDPANRIVLSDRRRDPLGLPLPDVRYRPGAYSERGLHHWQAFTEKLIAGMGGKLLGASLTLSSHHPAGTTRMGHDARHSVVDADCRSHDHPNLYIAGGSLFPSMGTANPTLTIAALSLRLAGYLKHMRS